MDQPRPGEQPPPLPPAADASPPVHHGPMMRPEAPGATPGLVLGICSIVGLCLGGLSTLCGCGYFIVIVTLIGSGAMS